MVGVTEYNWSLRKVDVLMMDVEPERAGRQRARLTFGNPTREVAGVQLAVQTFVSLLLTRKGTALNPDIGSDFIGALTSGRVRTVEDLFNRYAIAAPEVVAQVNSSRFDTDERIRSAILVDATVELQRITMTIQITTEDGETVTYLAPLEREV